MTKGPRLSEPRELAHALLAVPHVQHLVPPVLDGEDVADAGLVVRVQHRLLDEAEEPLRVRLVLRVGEYPILTSEKQVLNMIGNLV